MELDASLIEDLETVGLVTESGTVKVKDLKMEEDHGQDGAQEKGDEGDGEI